MLIAVSDLSTGNRHIVCQFKDTISTFGIWIHRNPLNFALPLMLLQLAAISFASLLIEVFLQPLGQSSIVAQILVRFSFPLPFLFPFQFIKNLFDINTNFIPPNRAVLSLALHY